jgi:hypothetical protein
MAYFASVWQKSERNNTVHSLEKFQSMDGRVAVRETNLKRCLQRAGGKGPSVIRKRDVGTLPGGWTSHGSSCGASYSPSDCHSRPKGARERSKLAMFTIELSAYED